MLLKIKAEREFQALEDANFPEGREAAALESFAPPPLTEEQQLQADHLEAEKRLGDMLLGASLSDQEMNFADERALDEMLGPNTPATPEAAMDVDNDGELEATEPD